MIAYLNRILDFICRVEAVLAVAHSSRRMSDTMRDDICRYVVSARRCALEMVIEMEQTVCIGASDPTQHLIRVEELMGRLNHAVFDPDSHMADISAYAGAVAITISAAKTSLIHHEFHPLPGRL